MLLKKQWAINEIKGEIRKQLETKTETQHSNLWDAAKAIVRGKFIVIEVYLKKQENSQINN